MGVTGKRVENSGIGGRARTMAGAGPTDPQGLAHCKTLISGLTARVNHASPVRRHPKGNVCEHQEDVLLCVRWRK